LADVCAPTAGFTFRYPPEWSLQEYPGEPQVRVASFDLSAWMGGHYPAGGVLVDFARIAEAQVGPRPTDSTNASLGQLPGWARRLPNEGDAPWAKSVIYAAHAGGYGYSLVAAFESNEADETIVEMIASTFQVTE
jgi:hypothetical protein